MTKLYAKLVQVDFIACLARSIDPLVLKAAIVHVTHVFQPNIFFPTERSEIE